jgi:O-antigen/teichoic acid export membrane protein
VTTDVLEIRPPANPEPDAESSLTWRASLNLVQSILDYSVKLAVGFLVVPLLVTGLGRTVFGVWEMLGRLMGYLESADGRPTQALRLVIASSQSHSDESAKRRWVGSALAVWVCFLPLWIATGALVIWLAPSITKVPSHLHEAVRIAAAVMMGGVLLAGLGSLPESVLRGMNLGYKRMGLQAGLSVAGGALLVSAVHLELGLVGVALASVTVIALTGLCFLSLVRRQVPWFGVNRPQSQEVRSLLQMSLWIATGDAVAKLLLASDALVLGMVLSPAVVTTYVLTGYAALLSVNLHSLAADAVMPGLAGIIGERRFPRAAELRRELLAVTVLFVTVAGSTILLWNRSFVSWWVGGENYAGAWTNLLLVLIAAQTGFIRCDAYIIDAALQPGRRVRVSAVAALFAITLSVVLTNYAGIPGLCLGILLGRGVQTIWYPILVKRCLLRAPSDAPWWLARPLLVMGILFGLAGYWGERLEVLHPLAWIGGVALTVLATFVIALRCGLPSNHQAMVRSRVVELSRRIQQRGGR